MSQATAELVAQLNGSVAGIKTSVADAPASVSTDDLPLSFVELGEGAARMVAGKTEESQVYRSIILIQKKHQATRAYSSKTSKELIPRFLAAYTAPANQFLARGAPNLVRIASERPDGVKCTGFTEIEGFLGEDWYGFILDCLITEFPNPTVSDVS